MRTRPSEASRCSRNTAGTARFGLGALLAVLALGVVARTCRVIQLDAVVVRNAMYLFTTFVPAGYAMTVGYNGLFGSSERIVRSVVVEGWGGEEPTTSP